MRQIILDTETTGLDPRLGHRVLELACVELQQRRHTKQHYHVYINPERASDEGALRVHGITQEFLADKPKFSEIALPFLEFIRGAELIIHNAPFDLGFLNAELARLGRDPVHHYCPSVIDTLVLAKERRPGKRNSLDALCREFSIDNSGRTLHGALLDATLLADVYLQMTRGQEVLNITLDAPVLDIQSTAPTQNTRSHIQHATESERAAHEAYLDALAREIQTPVRWRSLPAHELPH